MGNDIALVNCPVSEFQQLSSLALDICPVPSYEPNPLIKDLLVSSNSSLHLSERYRDAQNSLSPSELARFTRRLRRTFGREGVVTAGGVGVVALALAVLFDALAKEVKGQWVPRSGPIPGLFLQESGRPLLPPVLLVSDYLRLVPNIANNPARMREETERCLRSLEETYTEKFKGEVLSHVDVSNILSVWKIAIGLQQHHRRLSNSTGSVDSFPFPERSGGATELVSSFNCDLEAGNAAFRQEVLRSNQLIEELRRCARSVPKKPSRWFVRRDVPSIEFVFYALSWNNMEDVVAWGVETPVAAGEDFDLKAKSHVRY